MADDYNNYFSTFKIGVLGKGNTGNLQEYTVEELKNSDPSVDFKHEVFYADGSDSFANMGFVVSFMHVPSGEYVHFKAFIQAFNETFSSDWDSQSVYGRTDPIRMFKQTSRSITLSLMVPASSQAEGFENLSRIQKLTSYLYPSYESVDNALTISQSPLVRMRIMNMVTNNSGDKSAGTYDNMKNAGSKNLYKEGVEKGLLGAIRNISVNHNIDNPDMGSFHVGEGVIIPKAIEISLDFDVIHEKTLGWIHQYRQDDPQEEPIYTGQNFSDRTFPYGVNFEDSAPKTANQIAEQMKSKIGASTQERLDQIEEDNEKRQSEQMLQNAIAAGHVVAAGIVNGVTQYELSKAGRKAADRLDKRTSKEVGSKDWNPFNARSFPDQASSEAAAEYQIFLEKGNFNDFL